MLAAQISGEERRIRLQHTSNGVRLSWCAYNRVSQRDFEMGLAKGHT